MRVVLEHWLLARQSVLLQITDFLLFMLFLDEKKLYLDIGRKLHLNINIEDLLLVHLINQCQFILSLILD